MNDDIHTQQQRRSEYELADLLEDETLRVYEGFYLNNEGEFITQTYTLYQLILHSITAFDALILVQYSEDNDPIGEVAREWLLDFAQGSRTYGDYFCERIIDRIDRSDYQIKED